MNMTLIQFCFCQVIDVSSTGGFEQNIFNDSYHEFQLQSQAYNRENNLRTLQDLIDNNPKANSLHYKVGFATSLYLKDLNNIIPCLKDEGAKGIPFTSCEFKILSSEIGSKASHRVALYYTTPVFSLLNSFGQYMVLTSNEFVSTKRNEPAEIFTLKMQDSLSVIQYEDVVSEDAIA